MKKLLLFVGIIGFPIISEPAGLATELGEAVIGSLQIGSSYNLTSIAGIPLVVINTGEEKMELLIEPVIPNQTKEGYEPIPDPSWISLSKDRFTLSPQEKAITDIIITIPDDKTLLSKRYQVNIWSHTIGEKNRVGIGLVTRLLLHIEEPSKPSRETSSISLSLLPESLNVEGIKLGYVHPLKEAFIIENRQDEAIDCVLETIKVKDSYLNLEEGWTDTPNPSFLILSERNITLLPYQKKEVSAYLAFPKNKGYKKKNYVFIVHLKGISIPLAMYSRVYVKTK